MKHSLDSTQICSCSTVPHRLSRLVWNVAGIGPRTDTINALHSEPTAACWASQSAATHVRRRYADIWLLPSSSSHSAPGDSICIYRRRGCVDAVEPAPAEHCKDQSYLVCIKLTAASTTTGRSESWYWPCHTNYLSSRPRNLRRLRRVDADPRLQVCVQLLRCTTPAAQHSSVCVASSTTVAVWAQLLLPVVFSGAPLFLSF